MCAPVITAAVCVCLDVERGTSPGCGLLPSSAPHRSRTHAVFLSAWPAVRRVAVQRRAGLAAAKIKDSITLEDAMRVLAGAVKKAEEIKQPQDIAARSSA